MPSETDMLTFERTVSAPPAEVYRAFTSAAALRDWLCDDARVEARVGGRLNLWWNDGSYANGTFTTLIPGERVAFSWRGRDEPAPTRIQVVLAARDGGTSVCVTHAGIGSTAGLSETSTGLADGWPIRLENLQSLLETGVDLRAARRPMLGLAGAELLTPDLAARLGVPANAVGIVVGGVVAGMALEAAGLRKDDVMVSLDGKPVPDGPQLLDVLAAHQAGDRVALAYYRGAEQQTTIVELSSRPPEPDPPPTAALSEVVGAVYAELNDELAACFAGVSEEEAAYHPAPDEWNAKELVAHLIACERDLQSWIAGMLLDIETAINLESRPNVLPRLAALVGVYGTIPALLDEFRRSAAETVALLAALPDEFVGRKYLYRRTARFWETTNIPAHSREHFEQIRAAIAAARQF